MSVCLYICGVGGVGVVGGVGWGGGLLPGLILFDGDFVRTPYIYNIKQPHFLF